MTNRNIIFGVLTLGALLALVFLISRPEKINENGKTETGTSTSPIGAFDSEGNPIDIQPIAVSLPPAPDMSGAIIFPKTYSKESRPAIEEKMKSLQEAVKKDPNNLSNWIEIGSYWKLVENYEKAEAAWLYGTKIDPTNFVIYGNLGFLFGYYVHDNVKAEQYYLKAIEVGGDQEYLYFQTAEFYRDVMKNMSKARTIVDRGILTNPQNQNLKNLRSSLN
ncbi:MAG: hypothetical protein AAB706_04420 [Patescibacteria group bacterium]